MVRVFILRRILVQIDSRQPRKDEWACIGPEFNVVIYFHLPESLERSGEFLNVRDQIRAPSELEADDRPLPVIKNHGSDVIGHFALMSFHIGNRTPQAFFVSGKQYEANRP